MKLKTKRLLIIPLTDEQFDMLLNAPEGLKYELSLSTAPTMLEGETREAMTGLCALAKENPYNYPWYSSWQIILRDSKTPIGSACFMGVPDLEGGVEIGYGTDEEYRCRGYMKEAVAAICEWALSRPDVNFVTAKTEMTNLASQKVLTVCGFEKAGIDEEENLMIFKKYAGQAREMRFLPFGLCIGTCIGAVLGKLAYGEIILGIAVGVIVGVALGALADKISDMKKDVKA